MTKDDTAVERSGSHSLSDYYVYAPLAIAIVNGLVSAYEVSHGRDPIGYLNATIIALFWFANTTNFKGGLQ